MTDDHPKTWEQFARFLIQNMKETATDPNPEKRIVLAEMAQVIADAWEIDDEVVRREFKEANELRKKKQ